MRISNLPIRVRVFALPCILAVIFAAGFLIYEYKNQSSGATYVYSTPDQKINPLADSTEISLIISEDGKPGYGKVSFTSDGCPAEVGGVTGVFMCKSAGKITLNRILFTSFNTSNSYVIFNPESRSGFTLPVSSKLSLKAVITNGSLVLYKLIGGTLLVIDPTHPL